MPDQMRIRNRDEVNETTINNGEIGLLIYASSAI